MTQAPGSDNPQTAPPAEGETAPTEQSGAGGSATTGTTDSASAAQRQNTAGTAGREDEPGVVSDDQLPEDLRPTDDNPLAQPPSDDLDSGGSPGGGAGL